MGVTTLELDLGLTKDLVPVVSHDPYLNQIYVWTLMDILLQQIRLVMALNSNLT